MAWQYEPTNHPYGYPPADTYRLPGGLKALAIVVSLVKVIPLALGLIVVALAGLVSSAIIGDDSGELDGIGAIVGVVAVIAGAVIVVAAILVIGQFVTALRNRRVGLIVFAAILSALDLLAFVGSIASLAEVIGGQSADSAGDVIPGSLFVLTIAGAQIAVLVWAIIAKAPPPAVVHGTNPYVQDGYYQR